MKFNIQCVREGGARLGRLTEVGKQGDMMLDTPMCMLYTRGGSAPHLSVDMLRKVQDLPVVAHMPLNHLAQYQESIAGFEKGMGEFAALGDKLVYTSNNDPAVEVPAGYNDKSGIGLWGRGGKIKLESEGFIQLQEAVLPDWFQAMSDGDTDDTCTKKRAGKAVDRTLMFLDEILDRMKKSKRLEKTVMFGSIVGGYDMRQRLRSTRETVARNLQGYVLDGFHRHGSKSEDFDIQGASDLMKTIIKLLPDDKPRAMHSVWRPDTVLTAVELGIDIFDSSYPYIVTERGHALVFSYQLKDDPERDSAAPQCPAGLTIDLNDKMYVEDFSPLLPSCECYACQNFTRAYVNHLLNTSELLATAILMIHNFHHYFQYFKTIRDALQENRFQELKAIIVEQSQINNHS